MAKKMHKVSDEKTIDHIADDFTRSIIGNNKINLDLAGIFFISAQQQIQQGEKYFKRLQAQINLYNKDYDIRLQKSELLSERFYIPQLRKIRNMEILYEPVVRHFSSAKILLACCAEAYINEVASVKLKGKTLDEFDKLSIAGKWIFIQDILKLKKRITLDKNPLQGFLNLIKQRNKLVHFKGLKKEFHPLQIPDFLSDLSLSPKDCTSNMNAVKDLIIQFSLNWIESYGPDWLYADKREYRNPCFYFGNREAAFVLFSNKYDKKRLGSL